MATNQNNSFAFTSTRSARICKELEETYGCFFNEDDSIPSPPPTSVKKIREPFFEYSPKFVYDFSKALSPTKKKSKRNFYSDSCPAHSTRGSQDRLPRKHLPVKKTLPNFHSITGLPTKYVSSKIIRSTPSFDLDHPAIKSAYVSNGIRRKSNLKIKISSNLTPAEIENFSLLSQLPFHHSPSPTRSPKCLDRVQFGNFDHAKLSLDDMKSFLQFIKESTVLTPQHPVTQGFVDYAIPQLNEIAKNVSDVTNIIAERDNAVGETQNLVNTTVNKLNDVLDLANTFMVQIKNWIPSAPKFDFSIISDMVIALCFAIYSNSLLPLLQCLSSIGFRCLDYAPITAKFTSWLSSMKGDSIPDDFVDCDDELSLEEEVPTLSSFYTDDFSVVKDYRLTTEQAEELLKTQAQHTLMVKELALEEQAVNTESFNELLDFMGGNRKIPSRPNDSLHDSLPTFDNYLPSTMPVTQSAIPSFVGTMSTVIAGILTFIGLMCFGVKDFSMNALMNQSGLIGRAVKGCTDFKLGFTQIWTLVDDFICKIVYKKTRARLNEELAYPGIEDICSVLLYFKEKGNAAEYLGTSKEACMLFRICYQKVGTYIDKALTLGHREVAARLKEYKKDVEKLDTTATHYLFSNCGSRVKPVVVKLYGKPGTGKSVMLDMLDAHVSATHFNNVPLDTLVYDRKAANEFWDGYRPEHKIVHFDDAFQLVDTAAKPNPEIMEMIYAT